MKKQIYAALAFLLFFASFMVCDKDDDDKSKLKKFNIGAAAVESLPHYRASSKSVTSGTIADHNTLSKFFKLECYMPGGDNFCPAGVDYTTGGDMNPYKLTSFTLIGSIYHADMYSGGLKISCDGTPTTITASSFVAAQAGGNPAKYIIDYYNLLSCTKQDTGGDVGSGTKYQAYSVNSAGAYQATLTTRYRVPSNGVSTPGQNDVFEVYVALSSDKPVFMAYNYAGADTMYQRTILLVNTTTHKFAVKHFESNTQKLVAIGMGGVDRTTGVMNPGYYYTKFTKNTGTEDDGCIDNATGAFQTDNSKCTGAGVPTTWTTSDEVATYLGISAEEKTRLSTFLAVFNTTAFLTEADSPANSTTDVEQNFPKSINP